MNAELLKRAITVDHLISDRLASQSFLSYLDRVVIDSRPNPRRWGDVAEYWQRERAETIAPAVEYIAGLRPSYDGPLNFWVTLPKGSDKTSSTARMLNWLLSYSRKKLRMYAAAADADQARLIRESMAAEASLNPWLKKKMRILYKVAWGPGGTLEYLASDSASSQGKLPDLLVLDELVHWNNREFFDALYSARNKRPSCLVFVITNAGVLGTWPAEVRKMAMTSDRWHFYEAPVGKHLASWMNEDAINEDAKLLTPTEADRLLRNRWLDPGEESGFCLLEEALACRTIGVGEGDCRSRYFAGVDFGPRRDRTALALLRRDDPLPLSLPNGESHWPDATYNVVDLQCWHRPGGEVQIEEVEKWIENANARYRPQFVFDEYQMLSTIQKYEKLHYQIERFAPRGGAANYELAANLRSLIASRRIKWRERSGPTLPHTDQLVSGADTFEDELSQLLLRVTPSGYRFDHKSGKHDDRAVAVGMAALFAVNAKPLAVFEPPQPVTQPQFDFKSAPRRTFFGVR